MQLPKVRRAPRSDSVTRRWAVSPPVPWCRADPARWCAVGHQRGGRSGGELPCAPSAEGGKEPGAGGPDRPKTRVFGLVFGLFWGSFLIQLGNFDEL